MQRVGDPSPRRKKRGTRMTPIFILHLWSSGLSGEMSLRFFSIGSNANSPLLRRIWFAPTFSASAGRSQRAYRRKTSMCIWWLPSYSYRRKR